ncbi:hypothetical protein [Candidatus Nitrosotenuis cloacae]|uniref:hypothetical protein n=1 Tax=Candidatus Nitrosotenuis cloacae TaxID=1603555 RepID=UPI00227E03B5|nr:hypothetical protein [Candidatus Nitrosotenuis cloacae]
MSRQDWAITSMIAAVIAITDVAVIYVGVIQTGIVYWSIASVGIVTFFGMLIVSSYHARLKPSSRGTMRKSIAGSLISVYLIVLALGITGRFPNISDETLQTILEGFSMVIMTIIGFYFGSKGAAEVVAARKESKSQNQVRQDVGT